ncbi:MAG TPA: pilus assembly protein PilW [Chromatiaceae bacterium]|nr:pilus assembly protein PilW [Chromatiaceae bacterium]
MAGVISSYVANRQVFRMNENMAHIQESARIVNELMGREIRSAGGNSCGASLVANLLNDSASTWWADWSGGTVKGWDGTQNAGFKPFGSSPADRVSGTDAVLILSGSARGGFSIVQHDTASVALQLNTTNHGISANDIVLVCDPFTAAILQVTNILGANTTLIHNTGTSTPGNCSESLGHPGPNPCNHSTPPLAGTPKDFTGGILAKLTASFWYIGHNGQGGTSLYRLRLDGGPTGITSEEIVEGVTDLQLQYLTHDGTTLANSYVDAGSISDWSDSATNKVVAVRATLTLETLEEVGIGHTRINRLLSFTSSLRNRETVQ